MNLYSLNAPQLGEGVKDVQVVAFLKNPGERVDKDEPIVLVETEKAAMEIESPVAGIVREFKVAPPVKIPVGNEIVTIEIVKKEARSLEFRTLHAAKAEMRSDLSHKGERISNIAMPYQDYSLSDKQQALICAMRAPQNSIIPAILQRSLDATPVTSIKKHYRAKMSGIGSDQVPGSTEILSWGVLRAMGDNPAFRSTILDNDKTARRYDKAAISLAVALPNDELTTIGICESDCRNFDEFFKLCKTKIRGAREGQQMSCHHTVAISDISSYGIEWASPVIASPAMATLCIGQSSQKRGFSLSLAFDHRLANGVGAARFLNDVQRAISALASQIIRLP